MPGKSSHAEGGIEQQGSTHHAEFTPGPSRALAADQSEVSGELLELPLGAGKNPARQARDQSRRSGWPRWRRCARRTGRWKSSTRTSNRVPLHPAGGHRRHLRHGRAVPAPAGTDRILPPAGSLRGGRRQLRLAVPGALRGRWPTPSWPARPNTSGRSSAATSNRMRPSPSTRKPARSALEDSPTPRFDLLKLDRYATASCSSRAAALTVANSATSSSCSDADRAPRAWSRSAANSTGCAPRTSTTSSSSTTT